MKKTSEKFNETEINDMLNPSVQKEPAKITHISAIEADSKKLHVQGYLIAKGNIRKAGKNNNDVCNFLLSETKEPKKLESIILVLWGKDVNDFRVGDKVEIKNGYITTFNGKAQLNIGQYGNIKLLS